MSGIDGEALLTVSGIDRATCENGGDIDVDVLPAIMEDDVAKVRTWSQLRASHLEDRDDSSAGSTALIIAARAGSAGVLSLLIDRGANVDAVTYAGATALMVAAQEGHTECVSRLLDARAVVDARSKIHHATALHLACREGHLECVRLLANRGASLNDVVKTSELFANGATALSFAIFHSHREIEFVLRQLGAPDAPLTRDAFRSAIEWTERF